MNGPAPRMRIDYAGENFERRYCRAPHATFSDEALLEREWLATNAAGGYASSTLAGVPTRRYHGLLIAALPVHGRTVMLSHLGEELLFADGTHVRIGGEEHADGLEFDAAPLVEFRIDRGLPIWRYAVGDIVIEKHVLLVYRQNTVHVGYRLAEGSQALRLRLSPVLAFRPHDAPLEAQSAREYAFAREGQARWSFTSDGFPPLNVAIAGKASDFVVDAIADVPLHYRMEAARGYGATQAVLRPGYLDVTLAPDAPHALFIASTEPWEAAGAIDALHAADTERERCSRLLRQVPVSDATTAELVIAADAFVVTPAWRVGDVARGHAAGVHSRSIIAGYHWFTDWGRDTMISLEGLTLVTGRQAEAHDILCTFAEHVRDGLIPNLFPEGRESGLYHTADATLWFFHALERYVAWTGDVAIVRQLLPHLRDIVAAHLAGTRFGIGVDAQDGLLRQGADGYQLTWMDAKVGDWVVTPRRGKAVEINALWYNALCLMTQWVREIGEDAAAAEAISAHAARARTAFNARFWCAERGHLYDVVDGENGEDDAACRPNQVLAISLKHPVLARERWTSVMHVVEQKLLTPYGLRSLAPGHPDYKPRYFGDLKARDAAYHQGTVWAWLIGPYLDAWRKLHGNDKAGARRLLESLVAHLGDAGVGSISEVFDAEAPFTPRGCIAQAWSVAEVLRCWFETR